MRWIFPPQTPVPADLLAWAQNDLLARLLVQRGIFTVPAARAFIEPEFYEPAPPADLPDLLVAVELLAQAIKRQTPICVWGDFDVDGQTSTAVLVSILHGLGAEVSYHVPNRLTEGHGVRLEKLAEVLAAGAKLILTCDTGIEAHHAVEAVHRAGAAIIITDHHDLPDALPPAEAVVNPKRLPADHPLRELPGVGVAFKLAEALAVFCHRRDLIDPLLDLAALGIVVDVALQTGDTRYLLQRGLDVLRQTNRPGLLALIQMCNLKRETLTAEHIGFWLGPRLNALGRLGDAGQGVELLTTADAGRARILAAQLDALNERRKLLVDRIVVEALGLLADTPALAEYNAIVLAAADWHPGVIGIACSRLVEQYNRPVILLALRDGLARGSARSVPGCDIHQALKSQAGLLASFGGHPMAAGLALPPQNLTDFRTGLSAALAGCVGRAEPTLPIDAVVTLPQLTLDLLDTLQKLAPFGAGNPPIRLAVTDLTAQSGAAFGRARNHKRVVVGDAAGNQASVIHWNGAAEPLPTGRFDLALTLSRDDYGAQGGVQLVWAAAREQVEAVAPVKRQVIDLRETVELKFLTTDPEAVFWTDGALAGVKRLSALEPGRVKKLVIWQAPPGQDVLAQTLAATQPETVYLVARPGGLDQFAAFMPHLMGVIKYALAHYGGRVDIAAVATAMMHRPVTVRLGLDWLENQGKLRLIARSDETLVVRADNAPPPAGNDEMQAALLSLLQETAAYRAFVRSARLSALGLES